MPASAQVTKLNVQPIRNLRWWIGALLFASTVINYIDRQTLSLLSPYLKQLYHWTNSDYANLLIGFRIAYSIGQSVCGRLMDRVGTRRGLTLSVLWYSIVSMATALATGFYSFATFRFLLGAGESANWPGATKAVSEWFPKRERALATALFDSGSSIGGAVAPFVVFTIYSHWGWRPAFAIPGMLGFVWLLVWRRAYHPPKDHPRVSDEELQMILADAADPDAFLDKPRSRLVDLLKLPQTWGVIIARSFTDPVWFFIAADLGNFFGGATSGYLIKRGWTLGAARKALVVFGGIGVTLLIPTVLTVNLAVITLLFALATFCYAAFSTIANVLPSDLYRSDSVASVSGLSGMSAGIGTIIAFKLVGHFSDANQSLATHSFDTIIIVAGLVPFIGMVLVLFLVRNTRATRLGLVRPI